MEFCIQKQGGSRMFSFDYAIGETVDISKASPLSLKKVLRMRTKAFFLAAGIFLWSLSSSAQSGAAKDGAKDKVAQVMDLFDAAFKLPKEKRTAVEDIFLSFYEGQQKLKNNIQRPASGLAQGLSGQDFQSVRKRNEALIAAREKSLKEELTEDQYKKWKGTIEPSLHKRR
ncbi:hypothetical protein ABDK00_016710 [Niabella insulamsoli]|uniref:hypothetical protein n=1 Tax=Niabella insulamsoli TaxID=3144874 RepID=UPI0031FC2C27